MRSCKARSGSTATRARISRRRAWRWAKSLDLFRWQERSAAWMQGIQAALFLPHVGPRSRRNWRGSETPWRVTGLAAGSPLLINCRGTMLRTHNGVLNDWPCDEAGFQERETRDVREAGRLLHDLRK